VRLFGVFAIATLVALALQTTIPRLLPFEVLVPELTLVLVVDLALRYSSTMAAALTAFAIGYATDAFSGSQLGLNALGFTLVFILTHWFSRAVFSAGRGIGVLAVFGGVILSGFANHLASSGEARPESIGLLLPALLIQAALTAVCAPAIFATMKWTTRMAGLRQRGVRE
jgi:rod shape-determining protein MreD